MAKIRILITGDNGESLPPPYGGIIKRCLLHAKQWREQADVFIHIHHHHGREGDLGAGATYFFDYNRPPTKVDKIGFIAKNFFLNSVLFLELFLLQRRLYPVFDGSLMFYCAARGVLLNRKIKEYRPDVVVTETGGLQSAVALAVAKKNNLPAVLENYAEIQYKSLDDKENIAEKYSALWDYLVNGVDLVVPSSEHCALGPKKYLKDQAKIKIVYSGINFDIFNGQIGNDQAAVRSKFDLPQDRQLVMAVGALRMRKGHDHLFESLLMLSEDKREKITVVLCGMGDIPELKARAAEIGFPDERLKVFQGLSEEDLALLYSAMDCFCFPSITPRECMGMAMKEAMSVGLPIVAYDSGGIKEAIENGVNGILVPRGDKQKLAEAVVELLAISGDRREAMKRNNVEKAQRLFDIKNTASQLLAAVCALKK